MVCLAKILFANGKLHGSSNNYLIGVNIMLNCQCCIHSYVDGCSLKMAGC